MSFDLSIPRIIAIAVLGIVLIAPVVSRAQDTVYWRSGRPLTWSDYRAVPEANSPFAAITTAGIAYTLSYTKRSMKTRVFCYMLPDKSWAKERGRRALLEHEQLHFDITELFARRLERAFKAYHFTFATVGRDLQKIFDRINREKTETNEQYDKETNFSLNAVRQARWKRKIGAALKLPGTRPRGTKPPGTR